MSRLPFAVMLCAALPLAGCAAGNFLATVPATNVPPLTGYASYHAYGDSITAGVGVANVSFVYASLVADYNSVPLADYAISGDQACDVPTRQIFPNNDVPALSSNGLYSVLIGTNDADVRGSGAPEATFNLCHQAALSWLATPLESKLLATAPTVTVSGPSHVEAPFNAVTTDAAGAAINFPFSRTVAAPLYLWYRINDANPSSFSCVLDGFVLPAFSTAPASTIQTQNGSTGSVALFRMASLPAGAHVLRCTQTSAGTSGMGLLAIGGPPAAGTAHRPRVIGGLLTLQLNGQNSGVLASYGTDIKANVALLAGDGLDVALFDAAQYMTGTAADMFDALHPNTLGHQEIFQAFEQGLK